MNIEFDLYMAFPYVLLYNMKYFGLCRGRDEPSSSGPKSKACREKMRRDKLNDRYCKYTIPLKPLLNMVNALAHILVLICYL